MENNRETFVVRKEWIEAGREDLESEEMKEFVYNIVMYGLYGEKLESENRAIRMTLKAMYPNIDRINDRYEKNAQMGRDLKVGKCKYDPIEIYDLAHNQKMKVPEIVKELSARYPEKQIISSGIYSSKGWEFRDLNEEEFKEKLGENLEPKISSEIWKF